MTIAQTLLRSAHREIDNARHWVEADHGRITPALWQRIEAAELAIDREAVAVNDDAARSKAKLIALIGTYKAAWLEAAKELNDAQ